MLQCITQSLVVVQLSVATEETSENHRAVHFAFPTESTPTHIQYIIKDRGFTSGHDSVNSGFHITGDKASHSTPAHKLALRLVSLRVVMYQGLPPSYAEDMGSIQNHSYPY